MIENNEKPCTKCKEVKSFNEFHIRRLSKDGMSPKCKLCCFKYQHDNKERRFELNKTYRQNNAVKIKKDITKYRKDNVESISKQRSVFRQNNKEDISEYSKKYQASPRGKASYERTKKKNHNAYRSRVSFNSRNKDLYPNSCESCNKEAKVEAHHDDYNEPMKVKFLCKDCHVIWHKENTPLNRESGIFTEIKQEAARGKG